MTTPPTTVRCILCGHPIKVALAIGQMLKCPTCGTTFIAPDHEHDEVTESAPDASESSSLDLDAPTPHNETRSAPQLAIPTPLVPAGPATSTAAPVDDSEDVPSEPSLSPLWRGLLLLVAAAVVLGGLAFALMVWQVGGAPYESATKNSSRPESSVEDHELITGVIPFNVRYSAAGERAQRIAGIRVAVRDVRYGPVTAKTQQNEVVRTIGNPYLIIELLIGNRSTRTVEFNSWYGNQFRYRKWLLRAMLTDDAGRQWPVVLFDDAKSLQAHTPHAELAPGDEISDILVFEPPSPEALRDAQQWQLFLPSLAIGTDGGYGFIIDRQQVVFEMNQPADS